MNRNYAALPSFRNLFSHLLYPLTEPSVMPFTKRRMEKMKRTMTGMLAMA